MNEIDRENIFVFVYGTSAHFYVFIIHYYGSSLGFDHRWAE